MSLTTRSVPSPVVGRTATPGTFHLLSTGEALDWSEPVYRIHGFEPGEVEPSTALMLAHCHRDDRPALEEVLRPAMPAPEEGRSVRYRLLDATGTERVVLAALAPGPGTRPPGAPREPAGAGRALAAVAAGHGLDAATTHRTRKLMGLLVDLTPEIGATAARQADDMLAAAIASREIIDEAKGAAMLAYGLDGPAAFDFLHWHSEHLNVKVRAVAERLLAALSGRRQNVDPRDLLDAALAGLASSQIAPLPERPGPGADGQALPTRLDLHQSVADRSVVVRLTGEVDAATAPTLVAGLAHALRAVPAHGALVLDASGLPRLGPVAALHIGRLRRRCDHAGVTLRVVPPTPVRPGMRVRAPGRSM